MLSRWQRWLTITLALLTLTLLAIAWSLDGGVPAMLAALLVVPVGYAPTPP